MCLPFNSWSCLCQKCIINGGSICTKVAIGNKVHRDICSYHCIPIPYLSIIWYQNSVELYIPVLGWSHKVVIPAQHWYILQFSCLLGGTYSIIYAKWRVGLLYHRVLWRWLECWSDTSHICCGMLAGAFWVRIWVRDKIKEHSFSIKTQIHSENHNKKLSSFHCL
jgi:hypothetical protein